VDTYSDCSPDEHVRIARDFIATIQDEQKRAELSTLVDQARWWLSIFGVSEKLGLLPDWNSFRNRALTELLNRRLDAIGLRTPGARSLSKKSLTSASPIGPVAPAPKPESPEGLLRETVLKAISTMPSSELRMLKLPVGDIFDALVGK
jgi:hypothetical protein